MSKDISLAEEELCRYCFEGAGGEAGEMLRDICSCAGGQRCVHLSCLRRWQRMVLVSQPTHPAFYRDDERHHKCNVCASAFNIPPPTRLELMASFTGAEIAALISEGCVIGSHRDFDEKLSEQLRTSHPLRRLLSGYKHWIGGVYLITGVVADEGVVEVPMRTQNVLDKIRSVLLSTPDLALQVGGEKVRLAAKGDLANVAPENLRRALENLEAPCVVFMATGDTPDCGKDHVAAVNMTRVILRPSISTPGADDDGRGADTPGEGGGGVDDDGDDEVETNETTENDAPEPAGTVDAREEPASPSGSESHTSSSDGETDSDSDSDGGEMETTLFGMMESGGDADDHDGVFSRFGEHATAGWWKKADAVVEGALQSLAKTNKYPDARAVEITHFKGGPCDSDAVTTLVVPGGVRRGWTVVPAFREKRNEKQKKRKSNENENNFADPETADAFGGGLCDAIALACTRARGHADNDEASASHLAKDTPPDHIRGGQTVKLRNLKTKPELNGELAIVARFEPLTQRWLLRLRNGDGARVKPANMNPVEGGKGRVFVFWGDARWTRTQLLGEIARGHWGLTRGSVADIAAASTERRATLDGRLAFAPTTEMTEEWMRRAQRDMGSFRNIAGQAEGEEDGVGRDES